MRKHPSELEMDKLDFSKARLTPLRAMRLKCLDCCGFVEMEVEKCPSTNCPLYPYRKGRVKKIRARPLSYIRVQALKQRDRRGDKSA